MPNLTQFNADFAQLTLSKKTKIVLELPEGTSFAVIAEIAAHRGERIIVQFGNPQMSMQLQPNSGGRGLVATVNERGEVERARREASADDPEEAELFPQDGDSEEPETTDDPPEEEPFEVEDDTADADPVEEESHDSAADDDGIDEVDIPREAIEAYILQVEPLYSDIPYDFSTLLRRRREDDVTWMQLAKEVGVPSNRLQSAYQVFKDRVVQEMRAKGVA